MCQTASRALRSSLLPLLHLLALIACGEDDRPGEPPDRTAPDAAASSDAAAPCTPPLERCGGECVDTASSASHCGECDAPCGRGHACVAGRCTDACGPGTLACGGWCIDPLTDGAHCGSCDAACAPGERCVQGRCEGCAAEPLSGPLPIAIEVDTRDHRDRFAGSCGQGEAPEALYGFVAPRAGRYAFSTAGSRFNTVLYVLGEGCGEELACSDDRGGGLASMVELELARDQAVTVAVDGFDGQAGQAVLEIRELAESTCCTARAEPGCGVDAAEVCVCALDDFCCEYAWDETCVALAASGDCGACGQIEGDCRAAADAETVPTTLTAAIEEVDEVLPSCGSGALAPEALFAFTAPSAGLYELDTSGSDVTDTVLAVLDGASCGGTELACIDDADDDLVARATLALDGGQRVLIAVESWDLERGRVELAVRRADDLMQVCDAEPLAATVPASATGHAVATPNRLEPSCALFGSAGETLFAFTAPAAGRYRFDTAGSTADTIVQVLDGDCSGAELACNDDPSESSLAAAVELELLAGQEVVVNVDSVGGEGAFELSVDAVP